MNPEQSPESSSELKQIRTYQGDIASAIEGQDESLFSIQQAERARQGLEETSPEEAQKRRNKIRATMLLAGSFLLVGAGIAGGWYSYIEFSKKTALPEIETSPTRLVSSAATREVDASNIDRGGLISAVSEESSNAELPEGEVLHIELVESPGAEEIPPAYTTSQKFFVIMEAGAPGSLVRALDPIFMLGAMEKSAPREAPAATSTPEATSTPALSFSTTTPQETRAELPRESIFIILKAESYENAFAGMLEWEESMLEDIGPLFSTRALASAVSEQALFEDLRARNKDARVLRGETGETVLIYSFFDTETIVITDSEETLRSLLNRLENELLSR